MGCSKATIETVESEATIKVEQFIQEVHELKDTILTLPVTSFGAEFENKDYIIIEDEPVATTDDEITVSISGDSLTLLVNDLVSKINTSVTDIINDKENYPNIEKIEIAPDCTEFDIYLSGSEMELFEEMLVMSFYSAGDKYQLFNGKSVDSVNTVVKYIDSSTDTTLFFGNSNEN